MQTPPHTLTAVVMRSISFSVNRRFGGTYRLYLQGRRNKPSGTTSVKAGGKPAFTQVSSSAYSSTLMKEVISSSEKSVDFQRTTRRYIPEDGTLHFLVYFPYFEKIE
jgi:hypothetical protein